MARSRNWQVYKDIFVPLFLRLAKDKPPGGLTTQPMKKAFLYETRTRFYLWRTGLAKAIEKGETIAEDVLVAYSVALRHKAKIEMIDDKVGVLRFHDDSDEILAAFGLSSPVQSVQTGALVNTGEKTAEMDRLITESLKKLAETPVSALMQQPDITGEEK